MALYEYYLGDANVERPVSTTEYPGQTFTVGTVGTNENFTLTQIVIKGRNDSGASPGVISVILKAVDSSGHPTGANLSVGTFNANGVSTTVGEEIIVEMAAVVLSASTKYAFYLTATKAGFNLMGAA